MTTADENVPDAWKQQHDLLETYTQEWDVRQDLSVAALGCDRSVRLALAYPLRGEPLELRHWHETTRNVGTMRELAHALLAACEFVEQSNPVWAVHAQAMQAASGVGEQP